MSPFTTLKVSQQSHYHLQPNSSSSKGPNSKSYNLSKKPYCVSLFNGGREEHHKKTCTALKPPVSYSVSETESLPLTFFLGLTKPTFYSLEYITTPQNKNNTSLH